MFAKFSSTFITESAKELPKVTKEVVKSVTDSVFNGVAAVVGVDVDRETFGKILKDASYGRGAGTIPSLESCGPNPPWRDDGLTCWNKKTWEVKGKLNNGGVCKSGEEKQAGLCYKACDPSYHGVGPVCWINEVGSYRATKSGSALQEDGTDVVARNGAQPQGKDKK
jgi:hypothetical protein